MAITRVTAEWRGFTGAPGYSTFHFHESASGAVVDDARGRVHSFFSELEGVLPSSVEVEVREEVEEFDESSGLLVGYERGTEDLPTITGSNQGAYAGPAGAVIHWNTNTVVNGRRLRGRTFIVPMVSAGYESDGTLRSLELERLNDAAEYLSGGAFESTFCVWSRPQGGGSGAVGPVVSHRVPDMVAVLRSRRD